MMHPLLPRSFRGKLLLLVFVAILAAVVVQNIAVRAIEILEVHPRALAELSTDAAVMATHSAAALAFDDPDAATKTLATLDASPRVLSATILDRDGAPFASYRRNGFRVGGTTVAFDGHRFDGDRLVLGQKIEHRGEILGSLVMAYDMSGYYSAIWRNGLISIAATAGAIVLSMIVVLHLQRTLTGPIGELTRTAQLVSLRSDYSIRVRRINDDELGLLTDSFNEMLDAIEARDEDLLESQRELRASNQQLQQFAYVASHDLQEPLRKIQTFSSMLTKEYRAHLPEDAQDYLDRMNSAATRMRSLITALLTYSRVSSKEPDLADIDLNSVVEGVLSDLEIRLKESGGVVNSESLPTVHTDELHMRQLFQNLLGNALKFHRPDIPPVVTIRCVRENAGPQRERWHLTIEDNGIGFEQSYADRIFMPFQRLHGRNEYEGTGMGLAVCQRIVDQYGWNIAAKSQPNEGTAFTITIPIQKTLTLNSKPHRTKTTTKGAAA